MSGVKHTPGPWKLDVVPSDGHFGATGGRAYGVSSTDALGLSVPVVVWRGIARPASPEGQANARLIAAAPDLLEIAQQILDRGYVSESIPEERADHLALKAAIARARGEQSPNHSDQKEVGNG